MGVNSLPKTVTRQRPDCDLNPGPSAPESSTLITRLPSQWEPPYADNVGTKKTGVKYAVTNVTQEAQLSPRDRAMRRVS